MDENEQLKKEIELLKSQALARDMQTRQELTDMYTEMVKKLQDDWKYEFLLYYEKIILKFIVALK